MNNKTDIEEDIRKLEKVIKLAKETGLDRTLANLIENILADRERLNKEVKIKNGDIEWIQNKINKHFISDTEYIEIQEKANKYDSLVNKIKKKLAKLQEEYELLLESQSGQESNRTKYLRGKIHTCQELLEKLEGE